MSGIIVVGPDEALIEGLAQTLSAAGHRVSVADDISEAVGIANLSLPMIAVVNRKLLFTDGTRFRIPLALGGALVAYHCDESDKIPLPFPVQRMMLAALELPLEGQRLLALVANVAARARAAGRVEISDESPAPTADRV